MATLNVKSPAGDTLNNNSTEVDISAQRVTGGPAFYKLQFSIGDSLIGLSYTLELSADEMEKLAMGYHAIEKTMAIVKARE